MFTSTKRTVLILVLAFLSHHAFSQTLCSDPATCFGCTHPASLNYNPDAVTDDFQYCLFLEAAWDESITICSGESVIIGPYSFSDFLLCENGIGVQVLPNENIIEASSYAPAYQPGQPGQTQWLVSPTVSTTYDVLDNNNENCEPVSVGTFEVIVRDDCDCPDVENCDGQINPSHYEYLNNSTCECETIFTNCGCGLIGANNYGGFYNCSDVNLCEFDTYEEGVPVCSDDAVLLGPFDSNLTGECGEAIWSLIPTEGVFAIENYLGAGEGVYHFAVAAEETKTYSFFNNFNSECVEEILDYTIERIDDESCISGISKVKRQSKLKVFYAGNQANFSWPDAQSDRIEYRILDLSGRIVDQGVSENLQWQLSTNNLSPGIYLISGKFGTERFWVF